VLALLITTACASAPVAVYLDLSFRFEIVDGDGRVSTAGDR
jgi:hypothetical protein